MCSSESWLLARRCCCAAFAYAFTQRTAQVNFFELPVATCFAASRHLSIVAEALLRVPDRM